MVPHHMVTNNGPVRGWGWLQAFLQCCNGLRYISDLV